MSKPEPQAAAAFIVVADRVHAEINTVTDAIAGCFTRIEPRFQAEKYIRACASDLEKRNGWSISERAGDSTPDKTQRLLAKAKWDEDAVMAYVRVYVVRGLSEVKARPGMRVLALDESGQQKHGHATAGVKRQYMGCAGRVENGINIVYASYIRQNVGHAIIGLRQWIPPEHITDPVIAARTGLPDDLQFETKGQIAAGLVRDGHTGGIRPDFVVGDEVYGASPDLRKYCEDNGQAYVLRVSVDFCITLTEGTALTCKQAVQRYLKPKRHWTIHPAGSGSKGERLYAWAWIATTSPQHFLLIRRHIKTGECAYHYCHIPAGQPATLQRLITAAGLRWPIEECFEFGKDYFGLDQAQVRLYTSIKRHHILVAAALAIFAVTAAHLRKETDTQEPPPTSPNDPPPANPGMIPLTINEIKRLFNAITRRPAQR